MPTYGYECKSCKHTFDAFQSMKDEPLKICPKCGKEIRRLINGGTGIIFKGDGFYVTDKNRKSGGKAAADAPAKQDTAAGSSAAKDKPAAAESAPCPGCAKSDTPACPKAAS